MQLNTESKRKKTDLKVTLFDKLHGASRKKNCGL